MTADPEAAAKLGWAHVLELRAAVAAAGRTRDELGDLERESSRIVELSDCDLLVWHAGNAGKRAEWITLANGAVLPTTAGLAALRFYDLGLQHKGAAAMAAAMTKPK